MNPMFFIQMMKAGRNPQDFILNYLQSEYGNSPLGQNLLNLAKQNKGQEIEQLVRNIFNQRGVNFDKEFNAFKQQFGL